MSLQLALDQIQLSTWWYESDSPKSEKTVVIDQVMLDTMLSLRRRKRRTLGQRRNEVLGLIGSGPMLLKDLAGAMDLTICGMRNCLLTMQKDGLVISEEHGRRGTMWKKP